MSAFLNALKESGTKEEIFDYLVRERHRTRKLRVAMSSILSSCNRIDQAQRIARIVLDDTK